MGTMAGAALSVNGLEKCAATFSYIQAQLRSNTVGEMKINAELLMEQHRGISDSCLLESLETKFIKGF